MQMKIRSYFCVSLQCGAYLLRSSHAGQPCIILCMREFDWYLWLCPQCMQFARAERPCHQMSEDDLAIPKIWIELLLSVRTCTWPRNRFHFLLTGGKKTNIASPSPSGFLNSTKPTDSLQIGLYRNWQLSTRGWKKPPYCCFKNVSNMELQDRAEYRILPSSIHRTKWLNLHLRLVENVLSIHFCSTWNASRLTLAHWRKEYPSVREKHTDGFFWDHMCRKTYGSCQ